MSNEFIDVSLYSIEGHSHNSIISCHLRRSDVLSITIFDDYHSVYSLKVQTSNYVYSIRLDSLKEAQAEEKRILGEEPAEYRRSNEMQIKLLKGDTK